MIDPYTQIYNFNFAAWLVAIKKGELKQIEINEKTQNPIFANLLNVLINDFLTYIKIEKTLNQLENEFKELNSLTNKNKMDINKNLQKQMYMVKTLKIYFDEISKQTEHIKFVLRSQNQINSEKKI